MKRSAFLTVLLVLPLLLFSGCIVRKIPFQTHPTSYAPRRANVALGIHYTSDTLSLHKDFHNRKVSWFKKYRVLTGDALDAEVLSRMRPIVERLELANSPYPGDRFDFVLAIGMEEFVFDGVRATAKINAVLRGPGDAVLLERSYRGVGSPQIHLVTEKQLEPEVGLRDTTRDAMAAAVSQIVDDIVPFFGIPSAP